MVACNVSDPHSRISTVPIFPSADVIQWCEQGWKSHDSRLENLLTSSASQFLCRDVDEFMFGIIFSSSVLSATFHDFAAAFQDFGAPRTRTLFSSEGKYNYGIRPDPFGWVKQSQTVHIMGPLWVVHACTNDPLMDFSWLAHFDYLFTLVNGWIT